MSDKKIDTPYTLLQKDVQLITMHFSGESDDWKKTEFEPIKERIVIHLRPEQDNKCCYCKRELGHDLKEVDIEHIVPKSEYPQFMFEPKNLALSCPGCNTTKSDQKVNDKEIKKYPKTHSNIRIVHPHFSNYSDHIRMIANILYQGKDARGVKTIVMCGLTRSGLIRNNAIEEMNRSKHQIALEVEKIRTCKDSEVTDNVIDLINKIWGI